MYTLQDCYKALLALPDDILKCQDNVFYYRGTPVLNGNQLEYTWPRTEAPQILRDLGYNNEEESWRSVEKIKLWLIQAIYVQECPLPVVLFKNGKVRAGALNRFRVHLNKPSWYYYTPVMLHLKKIITDNWTTLAEESKIALVEWFDEDGNFSVTCQEHVLNAEGIVQPRRIRLSDYRKCNALICSTIGATYIPKLSLIVRTETIGAVSFNFSSEEWARFLFLYTQCSNCRTWTKKENVLFGHCSNCLSINFELQSYGTRATEFFSEIRGKHPKYSNHLLGVELEYEQTSSSNQKEILFLLNKELGNHAIFKRDGSLNRGVEICTRPASIDIHLEELTKFYNNNLIKERLEVKSTCGMHVHIDRRKMTALTLGKLLTFMQRQDNKNFLEVIAERLSNNYSTLGDNLTVTAHHRGLASGTRYRGLNVCNPDTAEIRIFKTPSTFETFQKNMEFVSALTSYVQPANSGIKDTNYGAFLKYVNENKSTYKALAKFNKEKF